MTLSQGHKPQECILAKQTQQSTLIIITQSYKDTFLDFLYQGFFFSQQKANDTSHLWSIDSLAHPCKPQVLY